MAFATLDDLKPLLLTPLASGAPTTRAEALLEQAARRIRAYTRRTFVKVTDDVIVIRSVGSKVRLPQTPVIAVTAVKLIDYLGNRYPIPTYGFDAIDTVDLAFYDLVLNLPTILAFNTTWNGSVEITYSHGYDTVPEDIVALNAELVARILNSPLNGMSGVRSSTTGPYSVTVDPTTGGGGIITLTDDDKAMLGRFKRLQAAVELR
jgi:hypothetical protein